MKTKVITFLCLVPFFCYSQLESKKQYNFAGQGLLNDDLIDFNQDGLKDFFIHDYDGIYYYKAIAPTQFAEIIVLDGVFERFNYEITDLDNDGDLDVVGYEKTSNSFVINSNEGNHIFTSKRFKINNTSLINYFTCIDIDHDGISEILGTSNIENKIYSFKIMDASMKSSLFIDLAKPFRITSLMDKNGPQICIQYDGAKIVRYTIDLADNIVAKDSGTGMGGLYVFKMLDINSDSIADLLHSTNYNAFLRFGNNTGKFNALKNIGEVSLSYNYDVFDIDNDQDFDLIFPRATEYSYSVFRNNGNDNFVNEQIDIDKKTKNIQLISTQYGLIDGKIYKNPLTNTPTAQTQIYYYNEFFNLSIPFDIDGDGDTDILAGSGVRDSYTYYENKNGIFYKNQEIDRPFSNNSTLITDFNNDGKKDILTLINGNSINWYQNLGTGNFSTIKSIGTINTTIPLKSIFGGDFNGDGIDDLGLVNEKFQVHWIARSGNSYNFNPNIMFNYTGNTDRASIHYAIDFDNDGDIDVLESNGYGGIDLLENNNGSFSGNIKILVPGFGSSTLGFLDVNNDGFLDILRLFRDGSGSSYVSLCINLKNNSILSCSTIAKFGESTSMTITDFNGDGLLDISVLEDKNNRLLWFFNRGNGSFSDAFVVDDNIALATTGDVFGDYHTYFTSNNKLNITMAVDDILYIGTSKKFTERSFLKINNEKCDQNNTTINVGDDFKSFDLFTMDFKDLAGTFSIFTQDSSWVDIGNYGTSKNFKFPKGSAGSGDKTVIIKNIKDHSTQTFIIKDDIPCFDTTSISELDGLMIFHNELNGKNWTDNSQFRGQKWRDMYVRYSAKENILPSEYCALSGVKCVDDKVVEVKIEVRGLSGQMSEAISYCKNLETLDLSGNEITSMPTSMALFKSLKTLDLFGNDLVGTIPSDLGEASNLVSIDLGANELTGILPESLSKLTKLERIILGGGGLQINKISGQIPESIGNLVSLKEINFASQPMTGVIPETFGNLKQLEKVNIFNTKIGGNLPESLANIFNPKLTVLNLNTNAFIGCFPESYKIFCSIPTFTIRYSTASKIDSKEFCETNKHNCLQDNDMDGFFFPLDCDDSNALVYPGAIELDFNNLDENCDGFIDSPCSAYDELSHNTFETAMNICYKSKEIVTLFPDGNRSQILAPCFENLTQYSAFWEKIKIYNDGTLYFEITPEDTLAEIDFAVYKLSNSKDFTSAELIRCNRSICKGNMGLSVLQNDVFENEGCDDENNNFLALMDVKKDEYYAILIIEKNNKRTNVEINLCGLALLGPNDHGCQKEFFERDFDGDGYSNLHDCNDYNPEINPGAIEIFYNEIDENCDGSAKLSCIDRNSIYNNFSSFERSPLICTKEPLKYMVEEYNKDNILVKCGSDNYYMGSYVTVQKVKILKSGSFYFTITPSIIYQSTSFGVYKTTNNFDKSTLSLVRCCLTGLYTNITPSSIGLSPFENDEQEGAYGPNQAIGKNGFVKSIEAKDGDEYTIYINSTKPNLSLTTTYCGTATFVYDDTECEISSSNDSKLSSKIQLLSTLVSEYLPYHSDVTIDQINVFDMNGKPIGVQSQDNAIDVSRLISGIYVCQFRSGTQFVYRKFVKI